MSEINETVAQTHPLTLTGKPPAYIAMQHARQVSELHDIYQEFTGRMEETGSDFVDGVLEKQLVKKLADASETLDEFARQVAMFERIAAREGIELPEIDIDDEPTTLTPAAPEIGSRQWLVDLIDRIAKSDRELRSASQNARPMLRSYFREIGESMDQLTNDLHSNLLGTLVLNQWASTDADPTEVEEDEEESEEEDVAPPAPTPAPAPVQQHQPARTNPPLTVVLSGRERPILYGDPVRADGTELDVKVSNDHIMIRHISAAKAFAYGVMLATPKQDVPPVIGSREWLDDARATLAGLIDEAGQAGADADRDAFQAELWAFMTTLSAAESRAAEIVRLMDAGQVDTVLASGGTDQQDKPVEPTAA